MHKSMLPLFLSFLLLLFSTAAFSQQQCGFDELHRQRMRNDGNYRRFIENFEKQLRQKANASSRDNSHVIDTIAVVVHVIHTGDTIGGSFNPDDAQIQGVIDYTNQVYAGTYPGIAGVGETGVRFVLAKRDPNCNPTTGIDRTDGSVLQFYADYGVSYNGSPGVSPARLMNFVKWDPYRYYNIWLVNKIGKDAVVAFAFFPSDVTNDGVFIQAVDMQPGLYVLPHELGHSLFLYHVFEGSSYSSCPANNDCLNDGDKICDTDPITPPVGRARTGINPCTNTPYSSNTENNFMGYPYEAALFTAGQKTRMKQTIVNNILRDTLTKSMGKFAPDEATACSFPLRLDGTLTENDIFLHWQPGGAIGKDYALEHSYDGTQFTWIGSVPYNSSATDYQFHDADITQQKNYYRLKQTISNTEVTYSNTVVIDNPVRRNELLTVLNNPAHNYIDMQFGLQTSAPDAKLPSYHGTAEVRLIDMSGRVLTRSSLTINSFQRLRIPVNNIAPGLYILQVWVNKVLFSKKIVKM